MLFWCHLIYTVVFLGFLIASGFICPREKEKYDRLGSGRKAFIAAIPYIMMVIVYAFPVMNAIVRADSPESFISRLLLEGATATFLNVMIFFSCTKIGQKIKYIRWLPYVGFFVYTLIKNFIVNPLFMAILAQALAIVTLAVFAIITFVLQEALTPRTKEELVRADQEYKERQEKRRIEEEQKRFAEEQARIQAEKDARTHEAYERIVLSKKTSSSSYSSYSSSSSNSRSTSNDPGARCCRFCYHYQGGVCNCEYSRFYKSSIWDPDRSACNYFY